MTSPRHIAIVCDGNRRWAKAKGLPEFSGHQHAVEVTMETLIDRCLELNIPFLTFWVFSTENWQRGEKWVNKYFSLLRQLFSKNFQKLHQKNVKLNLIGDVTKLPQDIQQLFTDWLEKTKNNQKLTLTIAINYGGRNELIRTVNKLFIQQGPTLKDKSPIGSDLIEKNLDTHGLPDPDLLIRTAPNNHRLSGFMLWQIAYTQLYFTDTLFPDFNGPELDTAISWWQSQTKNLGK
jgi:undecaprenyl diphosphate synthase